MTGLTGWLFGGEVGRTRYRSTAWLAAWFFARTIGRLFGGEVGRTRYRSTAWLAAWCFAGKIRRL